MKDKDLISRVVMSQDDIRTKYFNLLNESLGLLNEVRGKIEEFSKSYFPEENESFSEVLIGINHSQKAIKELLPYEPE